MYVYKSKRVPLLHFSALCDIFRKKNNFRKFKVFSSKSALRILSLRYSADFRRSRLVSEPVTPTLTWDTGTLSNSAATVTWSHETPVASSYQIRKDTPTSWEAVANTLATKTVSGFSAGTCDKLEFQALLTCDGPVTIEGAIENVDVCAG